LKKKKLDEFNSSDLKPFINKPEPEEIKLQENKQSILERRKTFFEQHLDHTVTASLNMKQKMKQFILKKFAIDEKDIRESSFKHLDMQNSAPVSPSSSLNGSI